MKKLILIILFPFMLYAQSSEFIMLFSGAGEVTFDDVIADGNTVGWYTLFTQSKDANDKVTSWTDSSGNGNHLLQSDTSKSPTQSSGGLLFDGTDDYLKDTFTFEQPEMIYIVFRQVSWTLHDRIWDGSTNATTSFVQTFTTPSIQQYAGSFGTGITTVDIGTYHLLTVLYDDAASSLQDNDGTPIVTSVGTNDAGGFVLGTRGALSSQFSNIEVKEIILRKVSDSETNQNLIRTYLNNRYSVY